jgi:hypothetical protein
VTCLLLRDLFVGGCWNCADSGIRPDRLVLDGFTGRFLGGRFLLCGFLGWRFLGGFFLGFFRAGVFA